jgi:predicted DNA-binding protein
MNPDTSGPKVMGQISLPVSYWEKLKALEARHERPKSWFVRKALEPFLAEMDAAQGAEVMR